MFEGLLIFFYSIVPVIAVTGFIPQIIKLIKDAEARKTSALGTWIIWNVACLASVLYAVFIIEDFLFLLTAGINLACHMVVLSVILKDRIALSLLPKVPSAEMVQVLADAGQIGKVRYSPVDQYVCRTAEVRLCAANRAQFHDLSQEVH